MVLITASFLINHVSDDQVAIKTPMYTRGSSKGMDKATQRLMREIITWKRISKYENVADLLGIYQTANDPPYLVLPYYQNNKLLHYLSGCLPDRRVFLVSLCFILQPVMQRRTNLRFLGQRDCKRPGPSPRQ